MTVTVIFCLGCQKKIDEKEPTNDNYETAQLISSGQEISASYYSATKKDKDYYKLEITKEMAISVELNPVKGIDSKITLYNSEEMAILKIADDNRTSLGELLAPVKVHPPYAIVLIEAKNNANDPSYKKLLYKLKVNLLSPPKPLEQEPNENVENATLMSDDHITGFFNSGFDQDGRPEKDIFKYSLTEEKRCRLKFFLSAVGSVDSELRIFDQKMNLLKKIDESGIGQGEEYSSLGIDAPADIYIQVYAKEHRVNLNEYYELKIEKNLHQTDHEYEPNDTFEKASLVSEEKTQADISDKNDKDFFQIVNKKDWPRKFVIEAIPEDTMDLKMEYFSEAQSAAILFNDSDGENSEGISNLIIPAQKTGYLRISAINFKSQRSLTYILKVSEEEVVELHETEPNNNPKAATVINISGNMTGYINPNHEVDFYKPQIEKKGQYLVMVDGIKNCKIKVDITDAQGAVAQSKTAANFGSGVSLQTILFPANLIKVSCATAKENLYRAPYNITISETE